MTKTKSKNPDLTQSIMNKIHTGKISMRPKIYFLIGSIILGFGLSGAFMLAMFLIAVSSFHFRSLSPVGYLRFGTLGFKPFLATVPWVHLFFTIAFILLGIKLIKRFDFSYRHNLLSIIISVITAVIVIGIAVDRIGANTQLRKVNTLKPLYRQRFSNSTWIMGQIAATDSAMFALETPDGDIVNVIWTESTRLPFGSNFLPGDHVRVIGSWHDDIFEAKGIGQARFHMPHHFDVKGIQTHMRHHQ